MLRFVLTQIVNTMSTIVLKMNEIFKSRFSEQDTITINEYFESKSEQKILQKKDITTILKKVSVKSVISWVYKSFSLTITKIHYHQCILVIISTQLNL